ncbi:MAG TPA: PspC domain-containing protein [Chryseolinea sp.]|nr:PspC domain-containing protein [Chryseolinea sp.]
MKKNISINISGIIFHIEEDGYENLRKYLDSINKYFATFEDSSEILADIESRVAEIFLSKLNEGKQVITAEDVLSLIATMGSVNDFKAAEDQEFTGQPAPGAAPKVTSEQAGTAAPTPTLPPRQQQLQRDQKRKILGGVCAGIANYFSIDAVWIRLIFALLAFAYGLTIIVYIIMWVIVPGSFDLEEPEAVKKMFRDGERKVIGGVSGGVAAFFGMDIIAVRLLFIIFTFFFGVGFVIYIVLWIALPEAKSLTDRMEMQGEPVTLSNIESNIKKNLNVDPEKEETVATKILLFPFRLIGLLLNTLGRILVPLFEILRVAIGIIVVLLGVSLMLAAIITGGVFVGLFSASAVSWPANSSEFALPLEVLSNSFSGWMVFAVFIAAVIPCILITLFGASIIAKRYVFGPTAGWSMFVLFFVSVAMLSVTIPKIVYAFKEEGEFKEEQTFPMTGKKAIMRIHEVGMDDYPGVSLTLKGYDGKDIKLVKTFRAQGATKQKAIENAKMVEYNLVASDSTMTFDSNILFRENAIFRAQKLDMTLFIPYHYPFVMDESVSRFISQWIDYEQMDNNTWEMTEQGLNCLSCPVSEEDKNKIADEALRDFNEVDVRGVFDVHIFQGDAYSVEMIGAEAEKSKYKVYRSGETLVIDYEGSKQKFDWNKDLIDIDEIRINITMRDLEKIEAEGYGKIEFGNFNMHDMDIDMRGPVKLRGELNADNLVINLTGKSEAELSGNASNLDAELQFASKLRAYNLNVQDALVEVNGASSAKVNVTGNLEIDEGLASDVDYRGTPNVTKKD